MRAAERKGLPAQVRYRCSAADRLTALPGIALFRSLRCRIVTAGSTRPCTDHWLERHRQHQFTAYLENRISPLRERICLGGAVVALSTDTPGRTRCGDDLGELLVKNGLARIYGVRTPCRMVARPASISRISGGWRSRRKRLASAAGNACKYTAARRASPASDSGNIKATASRPRA